MHFILPHIVFSIHTVDLDLGLVYQTLLYYGAYVLIDVNLELPRNILLLCSI